MLLILLIQLIHVHPFVGSVRVWLLILFFLSLILTDRTLIRTLRDHRLFIAFVSLRLLSLEFGYLMRLLLSTHALVDIVGHRIELVVRFVCDRSIARVNGLPI